MFGIHRSHATRAARRRGVAQASHSGHRYLRRRLTLEPLEERALLSTWLVDSLGDAGAGSGQAGDMRYVISQIDQIGGDNTVNFSVTGTITLHSALPSLNNTTGVTDIEGPGADLLTVSGSNAFRVFQIDTGATVAIAGLGIKEGFADRGGGIYCAGNLTLTNSTVSGNNAVGLPSGSSYFPEAGGDAFGGGLYVAGGNQIVSGCIFQANSAVGGSGIMGSGFYDPHGPAIWGDAGGSAAGGAIFVAGGKVQVQNSTITSNHAIGGRGGDANFPPDTGQYDMYVLIYGGSATLALNLIPSIPFNPNDLSGRTYWAEGGNGGGGQGGGIAMTGGSLSLNSNAFVGNQALGGAGGSATGGHIGYFDYGGYDWVTGQFFDIRTPLDAVAVSGTAGSSSGDVVSGSIALLQNNSFDTVTAATTDSVIPLVASQILVNQGQAQRSNIESLSVQFNQDTNVQALIDSGAISSAVQVVSSGGTLGLTPDRYHYDASTYTLTIDLTKGGGSHMTMLADGRYQLTLDTGQITALAYSVNHLNVLRSPVAADARVHYDFFRLLGDLNGDGVVNSSDLVIERNQIIGYAGAVPTIAGDLNGDGVVDISDYILLRGRLGKRV
jgi:hypothetical protein